MFQSPTQIQPLPKVRYWILIVFFFFTLSACGSGGGSGTFFNLEGAFAPGQPTPLSFNSEGQASFQFKELSGNESFALIFFAANPNSGSYGTQLTGEADIAAQSRFLTAPSEFLSHETFDSDESFVTDGDQTSRFHNQLRQEEVLLANWIKGLNGEKFASSGSSALLIEDPWQVPCAEGRGIEVKVLSSFTDTNLYEIVCAIEKRSTPHAVYYVDEAALSVLPDSVLQQVVDEFESKIARQRSILGTESDVNNDGRFAVCFCAGVNRLGATAGGYITGFFFGGDLFDDQGIPSSNEKEILLISVPDPSGRWGVPFDSGFWASNIAHSVLPHEYQHMINYNQKVFLNESNTEETWANEGLSHLMEDLNAQSADPLEYRGPENPSRVALFLAAPQRTAFTQGMSLAQRGGSYLFFRYLYEQANQGRYEGVQNGTELLGKLLNSPQRGIPNIETATGWSFHNLLFDFYAALQLSQRGVTENPRYNFQGIDLNGPQNDNRGTVLEGVASQNLGQFPTQETLSSPGSLFYEVAGSTLLQAGSVVHWNGDPTMTPGGMVIRLR